MRAYADTLAAAMARYSPDVHLELVEIDPFPASGKWSRRLQSLWLPARAWSQRRRAPDVWHVLDGSRAYVARALGPAPIVITAHDLIPWIQANGRFPGAPPLGAAARALWRRNGAAMRAARAVVCDSVCTARDAQTEFSVQAERCAVVPLPLTNSISQLVGEVHDSSRIKGWVLHVGNNGFYKNRSGVLRIFARIDSTLAKRLIMAGPAPTDSLRRLSGELGISDRIDWLVNPSDSELAGYYRRASALLFPSLYEGFGWPVLEAMAFGLPVVCSDGGSLAEVGGDSVPCFPSGDEEGMAAAVAVLLANDERASAAAARGLERAQEFDSMVFARRMTEVYRMAIASTGRTIA